MRTPSIGILCRVRRFSAAARRHLFDDGWDTRPGPCRVVHEANAAIPEGRVHASGMKAINVVEIRRSDRGLWRPEDTTASVEAYRVVDRRVAIVFIIATPPAPSRIVRWRTFDDEEGIAGSIRDHDHGHRRIACCEDAVGRVVRADSDVPGQRETAVGQ